MLGRPSRKVSGQPASYYDRDWANQTFENILNNESAPSILWKESLPPPRRRRLPLLAYQFGCCETSMQPGFCTSKLFIIYCVCSLEVVRYFLHVFSTIRESTKNAITSIDSPEALTLGLILPYLHVMVFIWQLTQKNREISPSIHFGAFLMLRSSWEQ